MWMLLMLLMLPLHTKMQITLVCWMRFRTAGVSHNDNNNNNGFICIAARMLDYTISAMQDSAYKNTNHHMTSALEVF